MLRDDYLTRLIEQVAKAIARMLGKASGGDVPGALQEAEDAYDAVGIPPDLVARADANALAGFLPPDKLRLLSKIVWHEGSVRHGSGDPLNGLDRRRKAIELRLEAQARDPQPDDVAALQEMFRHVPTNTLDARYRGD